MDTLENITVRFKDEDFLNPSSSSEVPRLLFYWPWNFSALGFPEEIHDELNQPDIKMLFELMMKVITVWCAVVLIFGRWGWESFHG